MTDDNYNSYEEPKVCNHYNYKIESDKWYLREDSFRDKNLITTPGWIVKDMLDLLPDSVWNTETTFLIPCIKSGNFAIEVKNRLFKCKDALEKFPDDVDRRNHIDSKQLFCIYWYTEEEFDKNLISGHIWGVNGFLDALYSQSVNLMCTDDLNFDTFKDKTGKKQEKLLESIKEKFGTVKFDVVIGNPPYNNDLYLDFVEWGHQRASKYSLWITPAKWQAKGGDKNERFRKDIVPHMKDIVYYPVATDVFDIKEWSGISYYIIDTQVHTLKNISNRCKWQKLFNNDAHNIELINLNNVLAQIIKKVMQDKKMNLSDRIDWFKAKRAEELNTGTIQIMGGDSQGNMQELGKCNASNLINVDDIYKYKAIMHSMPGRNSTLVSDGTTYGNSDVKILEPNKVPRYMYLTLYCGDINSVKSFISYMKTKFIRALTFASSVGLHADTPEFWRFVPDPGKFDHTFTDQELYKKYNLTDEEIHIIESVIKERK